MPLESVFPKTFLSLALVWHACRVVSLVGTRATSAMCSQQMALVSAAFERSGSWNECIEDADTPNNEDSLDRVTSGKRAPREQRAVMPAADGASHVLACEIAGGPPLPHSSMINQAIAEVLVGCVTHATLP